MKKRGGSHTGEDPPEELKDKMGAQGESGSGG